MKQNTASQRIASDLRRRIRSGELRPGDRVPSAREIVRDFGVAIATAAKVLAALRREGLVRPEPGVGTIVRAGGARHEITREVVVRTAIAIADEDGIAALGLRQIATELGVATVTLRNLFASEDELQLAMADAVLGEHVPRLATDPRASLEQIAREQWTGYRRHPWLVQVLHITRPQLLPNGMRHTEAVLEAVDALGFGPEETLRTGVALLAFVRGMALSIEDERRAAQDTGLDQEEWIRARDGLFAPFVPRFPMIAKLTRLERVDVGVDALFDVALGCWLDGLVARAPGPRRPPAKAARSQKRR